MTNNIDNLKAMIDARIKSRDIEKIFDDFIERVTDTVVDDLPFPHDDEDSAVMLLDYIMEKTFAEFNLRYIDNT